MGGRISRIAYERDLRSGKKDLFDITSSKEVLMALLLVGGTLTVLHFAPWLLAAAMPLAKNWKDSPTNRRRFSNTFSYMKRRGYIEVEEHKGKTNIELTQKGEKHAQKNYARVLSMQPLSATKWDGKWRLILFDVPTSERSKRNAFRALISRLGAIMVQKSVWLHPYDCMEQIDLLKEFFELSEEHVRVVVADSIGEDTYFRKHFKLA